MSRHRLEKLVTATLVAGAACLAHAGTAPATNPGRDPRAWIRAMSDAAASLQDYAMTLHKQEWIDGVGMSGEEIVDVKWARGDRYYFKKVAGSSKGREVLFKKGWNGDRLKVSLNTWPNVRLNLDPYGKLALGDLNRPIYETSLVYLVDTVVKNIANGETLGEDAMRYVGSETVVGRACTKVEVQNPTRTGTWYTAQSGEDLLQIGAKVGHAARTLSHANRDKHWKDVFSVRAGDRVYVPRYYASRIEVWIDDETHLPLRALIYDDDGVLFERFEHHHLRANVGLTDVDFSPDNPSYKF